MTSTVSERNATRRNDLSLDARGVGQWTLVSFPFLKDADVDIFVIVEI